MGNRNSTHVAKENKNAAEDTPAENNSGVFLTQDFQSDIIQAFQSKTLQQQFQKLQTNILTSYNESISEDELRREKLQRDLIKWRDENTHVHKQLNERMDDIRAKFSDMEVSLRYDLGKIEEKKNIAPKFETDGKTCLNERVELTNCYKEVDDLLKCDGFIEGFERCIKKTVMST